MSFNPEDKIRWEELAPSLQAMFKNFKDYVNEQLENLNNRVFPTPPPITPGTPVDISSGVMENIIEYKRISLGENFNIWWKVYDDGWCEQGGLFGTSWPVDKDGKNTHAHQNVYLDPYGYIYQPSTYTNIINFPKPFKNRNYSFLFLNMFSVNYADHTLCYYKENKTRRTRKNITMQTCEHHDYSWEAKGFVDLDEIKNMDPTSN